MSQHREASKPGVKKAHDAGDPKALNRREGEANMAKMCVWGGVIQELWSSFSALWVSTDTARRLLSDPPPRQKRVPYESSLPETLLNLLPSGPQLTSFEMAPTEVMELQ